MAWGWLASLGVTARSPALLVQGDAVNATLGTEDVELPGLGQQLHMPYPVRAPVHGLGGKAERNVTFLQHPEGRRGWGCSPQVRVLRKPRCPRCQPRQNSAHPHQVKKETTRRTMLPPRQPQRNCELKWLFPENTGYKQFPGITLYLGSTTARGPCWAFPGEGQLPLVRGGRGSGAGLQVMRQPATHDPRGEGK